MRTRTLLSAAIALLVFLVSTPVIASVTPEEEFADLVEEFADLFEEYEDMAEVFADFVAEVLEDPEEFDELFDDLAEEVEEFHAEFDELFDELAEDFSQFATPLSSPGVVTDLVPQELLFIDDAGNLILTGGLSNLALSGTLDGDDLFDSTFVLSATGEFVFHGNGVFIGRVNGQPGPSIDAALIDPFVGRGSLVEEFVVNKFAFRGGPGLANVHIIGTAISDTDPESPFALSGLTFDL